MPDPRLDDVLREVEVLKHRLAAVEQQRRVRLRWLVAAVLTVASVAFAQLTVFTPDTPAYASEVNGNFAQLKTWLEQKVGAVGSPNVAITGTTTLASATVNGNAALGPTTISGTTSITGATNITGATGITGNLTVSGRVAPNYDSGWQAVTIGNNYTFAHNFNATPSQIQLLACGAISGNACTTRVVLATSGFNDGSSCINPINTMTDLNTITVALTPGCNAWGYYLAGTGFQYVGDADGNLGTAFYRVLAWR
ncbi:MAG: hypothetical protein JNM69_04630 [Archangium sp.]|nr:hypothetical protein [Archangium sp.]